MPGHELIATLNRSAASTASGVTEVLAEKPPGRHEGPAACTKRPAGTILYEAHKKPWSRICIERDKPPHFKQIVALR